jgi:hypothetical protein
MAIASRKKEIILHLWQSHIEKRKAFYVHDNHVLEKGNHFTSTTITYRKKENILCPQKSRGD